MDFSGKTIAIAVTGSIAAYKVCDFIRELYRLGASRVLCVMSDNAQHFISALTLQSLSRNPVYCNELAVEPGAGTPVHITLAQQADALVVFPATTNTLAKLAMGLADDLVSTTAITFTGKPVLIVPAMNTRMWEHPLTQQHMETLKNLPNYCVLQPESGLLACGEFGDGHLPDMFIALRTLYRAIHPDRMLYHGVRAMVTAGGTEEAIDAVRVITNRSSGKMGIALADALDVMGASVCLITTRPVPEPRPYPVIELKTVVQMQEALRAYWDQTQFLLMAAAISDVRVSHANAHQKLKTSTLLSQSLILEKNPDLLESLARVKRPEQYLLGFAAESGELLLNAEEKLIRKQLDAIVANTITEEGTGFGADDNEVSILFKNEASPLVLQRAPKWTIAEQILRHTYPYLRKKHCQASGDLKKQY